MSLQSNTHCQSSRCTNIDDTLQHTADDISKMSVDRQTDGQTDGQTEKEREMSYRWMLH